MHHVAIEGVSPQLKTLLGEALSGEEVVFTRGPIAVLKLVPIGNNGSESQQTWLAEMQALRGMLQGIDTTIPREKDRLL